VAVCTHRQELACSRPPLSARVAHPGCSELRERDRDGGSRDSACGVRELVPAGNGALMIVGGGPGCWRAVGVC
jgi:hypothetical protein